jgi:hypothetical protein
MLRKTALLFISGIIAFQAITILYVSRHLPSKKEASIPIEINGNHIYDHFLLKNENSIGFIHDTSNRLNLTCIFKQKVVQGETQRSGYLWATMTKCDLPFYERVHLRQYGYVDFQLRESYNTTSIPARLYKEYHPKRLVSNCAMYRNDENIVEQWIRWGTAMGIEHFYMYDHNSTDSTNNILRPFVQSGLVTYVNWRNYRPEPHTIDSYHKAQDAMILSCFHRHSDSNDWIFFADTDEFIYPINAHNFTYLLDQLNDDVDGVAITGNNWQDDLTNPLPLIPDSNGETTLVESFPLNMTFLEKYQYECQSYTTDKIIARTKRTLLPGLHDLNGSGKLIHIPQSALKFMHFRMERYGRGPSDTCVYDPEPNQRFGHLLK